MKARALCTLFTAAALAAHILVAGEEAKPPEAPKAALATSSGRTVFWRGENVALSLTAPLNAPTQVTLSLMPAGRDDRKLKMLEDKVQPADGRAYLNVLVPTDALGDGTYRAVAEFGGQRVETAFTVRESTPLSPGMVIDDNTSPGLAPNAGLAGQTAYIQFMSSDATGERYSESAGALNNRFDAYMDQQILFWIQDATRPMSFCPPHSSPDTDGEYLRRMLLMNHVLMRYPAHAGQFFDYDPTGFLGKYQMLVSYWGWGNLRDALKAYMQRQEDALRENFHKETGLEPLSDEDALRLAAATGSPEGMGYIDAPTRRWAYEISARSPEMKLEELEALKKRALAWYGYLMTLDKRRYTAYVEQLRALDPTLVHSTSNTLGHVGHRDGGNRPAAYEPLDIRFLSVWDDQAGAPEYIYETVMAATLLNGNRSTAQPMWVDTVFGFLPGNHFRNTLLLAGRGAQGTGYSFEMGSSLSYYNRGEQMLRSNSPFNQEVALNAAFVQRFGSLFANARHAPLVGLLYSDRQAAMTPFIPGDTDAITKMMYLLSHVNLPPAFVTEKMIEDGLPEDMKALIVLWQGERLSEKAEGNLRTFVRKGGRIIADTHSTVPWDFMERSDALDLPFRSPGHPYNIQTAYNRQDASVGELQELAAERCPRLRALLQGTIYTLPLDCTDPDVAISFLRGGEATFAFVVNDSRLDFSQMFTDEQRQSPAYQKLFVGHGEGVIGSWMPRTVELLVGPTVPKGAAVCGLLGMWQSEVAQLTERGGARILECDLSAVPGRIYAIYPTPAGAGRLEATRKLDAGSNIGLHYQATDTHGNALAAVVPVQISLLTPEGEERARLFRATGTDGHLYASVPTGLLDEPGDYRLEVCQLVDGNGVGMDVSIKGATNVKAVRVSGPSVRDPSCIRAFLKEKPEIVVPVFDASLKPAAEKAVAGLKKMGVKAQLWENPPTTDYTLAYTVNDAQRAENEKVDRGEAFGKVQFRNGVHHVNANFYGSAMTGWRCGKSVLLLGVPGKNPVLDAAAASGVLWTDGATASPGGALVQRVKWLLDREQDTIVVLGADMAGLEAGVEALLSPPESDPVSEGVRRARTNMLHGHGVPLTWQQLKLSGSLSDRGVGDAIRKPAPPVFSLAGVRSVRPFGDRLLVTLNRWGHNIAIVGPKAELQFIPNVATSLEPQPGKSLVFVPTHSMVFAWNTEGRCLWRAMGQLKAVLPGTDDAVVEGEGKLYRISPDAKAVPFEGELPKPPAPEPRFKVVVETEKKGHNEVAKGASIVEAATGNRIEGFKLTPVKPYNQPWTVEETLVEGKSGETLLVFRRYLGENSVQLYTKETGKVTTIGIGTRYLTDAALSADEKTIAMCAMEGRVLLVNAQDTSVAADLLGAIMPHDYPYPHLFALENGFAIGSADGHLAVVRDKDGWKFGMDLARSPGRAIWGAGYVGKAPPRPVASPEESYRLIREAPLLAWSNPPVAQGPVPLDSFYWYARTDDGALKMVNWSPQKVLDFRWMDAAQAQLQFPEARAYTLTLRAAAKHFDDEPLAQPNWEAILAMRKKIIKNERPEPLFRILIDGKPAGAAKPEGGALKPFVTPPIKEGWATLNPKDDELTTFTAQVDLAAGPHTVSIQAESMQDCYVKALEIR